MHKPVASETGTSRPAIRTPSGKTGRDFELSNFKAGAIRKGDRGEVMIEIQSSPTSTFGMVQWHLDAQARNFRD